MRKKVWKVFVYEKFTPQDSLLDCQRLDRDLLIEIGRKTQIFQLPWLGFHRDVVIFFTGGRILSVNWKNALLSRFWGCILCFWEIYLQVKLELRLLDFFQNILEKIQVTVFSFLFLYNSALKQETNAVVSPFNFLLFYYL